MTNRKQTQHYLIGIISERSWHSVKKCKFNYINKWDDLVMTLYIIYKEEVGTNDEEFSKLSGLQIR